MFNTVADYFASDPSYVDLVRMLGNTREFWSRVANNTIPSAELLLTMDIMAQDGRAGTSATYHASLAILHARISGLLATPQTIEGE